MSSNNSTNPASEKNKDGFWILQNNIKVMKKGIEENNAPFLPDSSGNIKAEAIYNASTGYCLPASRLIPAQFAKAEKGFSSEIVATHTAITKMEIPVKENEEGIRYNYKDETGEYKSGTLYFPEQTESPETFLAKVSDKLYKADRLKDISMVIASSDPKEYLATYLAACKSGMKLSVDPQLAEEFKTKLQPYLEPKGNKTEFSLSALLFEADKRGFEIKKELEKANGIEPAVKPQKSQEYEMEVF